MPSDIAGQRGAEFRVLEPFAQQLVVGREGHESIADLVGER